MTFETHHGNPHYDAYMDEQTENLETLAQNPQFIETLKNKASCISTTIKTEEAFVIDTNTMPIELEHVIYLPSSMIVEDMAIEMVEHPGFKLWSLNGRFTGNRATYGFTLSESTATIYTEGSDGGTLTCVLPSDAGYKMLGCFARSTGYSDTVERVSTTPRKKELNLATVYELLRQLGESYGYIHTKTEAKIESLSEFSRVLSVDFSQLESPERSSHRLLIDSAVDFGAKKDDPGTTAMTFSQSISSNSREGTVVADSWVIREPVPIPIESYLQEKDIFGSSTEAPRSRPSVQPKTFGQVAAFIMVSLDKLLYQDGLDTPDTRA